MDSLEKQITSTRKSRRRTRHSPAHVLAGIAIDAMLEKKGREVIVMDMREVSGVADYFVICTGDSDRQINAIAEEIGERIKGECGERPWHTEGTNHLKWVLLDYVDVVVHIFDTERRSFYDLERLWGDAPKEEVQDEGSSKDVELLRKAADGTSKSDKDGGNR